MPGTHEGQTSWDRTELAQQRLRPSLEFEPPRPGDREAPYGRFAGRPIIGSGMSRIIGGVYLGAGAREAIVVDDKPGNAGAEFLNTYYQDHFLPQLRETAVAMGVKPKSLALHAIYRRVLDDMPSDLELTERLIDRLCQRPDQKVHLASFLMSHVGVCRHQALLVAYLIEKLTQETDPRIRLTGTLSVERNGKSGKGAHAWVRYTTSGGEVWIIDVTQKRIGRLQDLIGQPGAWEYARPEDLAKINKR